MIDLRHTRAGLLAKFEASDPSGEPLSDITDPRVATGDARVRFCGHARQDLFPLLHIALSERFAAVPRLQLLRDLLMPLKHALGNACQHGNGSDPAKTVSVEIVMTRKGILIALTDEGPGFDVARTFRRFQQRQDYFVNRGAGFRSLHQAISTVSYENGGRTVLLCYRPADSDQASSSCAASAGDPTSVPGGSPGRRHALPKVLDSGWMRACLSAEVPEFGNARARIESCRIYATGGLAGGDGGNRYVLRVAGPGGEPPETRILIGRLHASEAASAADFEAATRLHEAKISKSVLIPRPVARPAAEPRLVLYDFDPWMSLWEYLTYRRSVKALRHCAKRIGRALAHLHGNHVVLGVESDSVGDGLQAMVARAETTLQTLPSGPDLVNRFRVSTQRFQERRASWKQRPVAPIHGALGWDCIHYGVDGRFYLYRFERCRQSDPGLDLGGFAADLLCFTLAGYDDAAYCLCRDAFLSHYNSEAEHPMREDDLQPYIVLALCERLQRAAPGTKAYAGELLAALDAALYDRGTAAVSEVSSRNT